MNIARKTWTQPRITAVSQMAEAQVAGYPMGLPKTSSRDTEGIYQGGNS